MADTDSHRGAPDAADPAAPGVDLTDTASSDPDSAQTSESADGAVLSDIDLDLERVEAEPVQRSWWKRIIKRPSPPSDSNDSEFLDSAELLGGADHTEKAKDGLSQRHRPEKAGSEGSGTRKQISGAALIGWSLLLIPLGGLLYKAFEFDRSSWPTLVGDEAVYLMAAQSLAWDGDFEYSRTDYDRFIEQIHRTPDGLILQSPDQGRTLFYGKAWLYPLAIAPFVKAMPQNGYAVANTVYLALAALLAAWALRRVLHQIAPIFVAVCVFASITFAHVFWAHPDLFLMCCVAAGCALLIKPWLDAKQNVRLSLNLPNPDNGGRTKPPWWMRGAPELGPTAMQIAGSALLVAAGLVRPAYLPLLLIPIVTATNLRRLTIAVLSVGGIAYGIVQFNTDLTGVWSPYAGERQSFYGYTGFPTVSDDGGRDTEAAMPHPSWERTVEERGDTSWTGDGMFAFPFEPHQFAWNSIYVLIGRNTGLFPYFLPFLLGLFAFRSDRVSWYLLLSAAAIVGLFLIIRPFNYYGGGGALANRYFLPIYPLTWFLARRPLTWRWPALITAIALLALLPKWIEPGSYWRLPSGAFSYVSEVSERFLPHESTQSNLKPADREDFEYFTASGQKLWVKPLSPRISPSNRGRAITLSMGPNRAEVLVASEAPIKAFHIDVDGQRRRTARFRRPSARHRMWWTFDVLYLYRFDLEGGDFTAERRHRVTITPVAGSRARG